MATSIFQQKIGRNVHELTCYTYRNLIIWIILVLLMIGLLAFIINTLRCMYINKKKKAEEDLEDLKALQFGPKTGREERIELN
mgnify:FL=1